MSAMNFRSIVKKFVRLPYSLGFRATSIAARIFSPVAERADNPYSTHLPILIGIARLTKVQRVLELGSGEYSSLIFLNLSVFPDLVTIDSFENDRAWADKIADLTKDDSRIHLQFVDKPMSTVVTNLNLNNYDVVFIDDSITGDQRAATIREVSRRCHTSTIVIIHDFEYPDYRRASRPFLHRFAFTAFNPNTGLLWNEASIKKKHLRELNRLIQRNSNYLQPEDCAGWLQAIDKHYRRG